MANNKKGQSDSDIKTIKRKLAKYEEIETFLNEAKSYLEGIKSESTQVTQILQNLNSNLQSSNELLEQSKTVSNDVLAIKETTLQGQTTIEEQKAQVSQTELKSKEAIEKLETAASSLQEETNRVAELREEVTNQLTVATGGTLAASFEDQKNKLVRSSRIWGIIFSATVFVLTIVAFIAIDKIINAHLNNPVNVILRASIILPLTYAMFLFANVFRRNRELEEEYSFKRAVAFSLAGYQKILTDIKEISSDEKITQFLTNSIGIIYSPPKRRGLSLNRKNEDIITQVINTLKEIGALK